MTSRDFAYWLMGFYEITNPKNITEEQTAMIKKHLDLVFYHEIDPSYTNDKKKQEEMNKIHFTGGGSGAISNIFPREDDTLIRC